MEDEESIHLFIEIRKFGYFKRFEGVILSWDISYESFVVSGQCCNMSVVEIDVSYDIKWVINHSVPNNLSIFCFKT